MEPDRPSASHITIVVHSLNRGGAQQRLVTLANAFAAAGRKVDVVALRRGGDADTLLDPGVNVSVLNERRRPVWKPWTFEGWGKLARWIERNRPDVLLAGINTVHATSVISAERIRKRPPLLVLRASQHPLRSFPWSRPFKRMREPAERWLRRRLYDRADLVVAVSREVGEAVREGLRHPGRCIDLPNPVITPEFAAGRDQVADHPWLREEEPLILAIGRLTWSKRFDVLLEALAKVREQTPARLIILGEGRERTQLEARAEQLGLGEAAAMPGNVANVAAWLDGADLLVSTSAYEGSPAVLIEALAAGVPVVATRCPGGSEELLEDGLGGTLVAMDDPAAAADAIVAELGRKRDRAELRRLVERYGVEASAAAYLTALDEAAARRRR